MPRHQRSVVVVAALALAAVLVTPASAATADDPAFAQALQWNLEVIGAPDAWDRGRGEGTTIAVVDSGIDLGHEDLRDKLAGSVNCIGSAGDVAACRGSAQDDNGHGTHVAGIAAAATDNGTGVASVAPDARLLAVRVLRHECDILGCTASGSSADVAAGIRWALDQGADVINLSLGSATQALLGPSFSSAVDDAWARGAVVVVAAGNDVVLSSGFSDQPAIVVTATNREDRLASYANGVGPAQWGMAAPGGESGDTQQTCGTNGDPLAVLSTYWAANAAPNQYACLAGTSMAAPHVAGAAAVLRSMGFSPSETVTRLLGTADDLGPPGTDRTFGAGRLNLARASDTGVSVEPITPAAAPPPDAPAQPAPRSSPPAGDAPVDVSPEPPADGAPVPTPSIPAPDGSVPGAPLSPAPTPAELAQTDEVGTEDGPPLALVVLAAACILATGAAGNRTMRRIDRARLSAP